MSLRAPTVRKGQRLTPGLWNELARAVNQGLAAPRDKDQGVKADEVGGTILTELDLTTTTERVFNPDDAEQWVDVARRILLKTRNQKTGEISTTYFIES